jgi:hypothetical protein
MLRHGSREKGKQALGVVKEKRQRMLLKVTDEWADLGERKRKGIGIGEID